MGKKQKAAFWDDVPSNTIQTNKQNKQAPVELISTKFTNFLHLTNVIIPSTFLLSGTVVLAVERCKVCPLRQEQQLILDYMSIVRRFTV